MRHALWVIRQQVETLRRLSPVAPIVKQLDESLLKVLAIIERAESRRGQD